MKGTVSGRFAAIFASGTLFESRDKKSGVLVEFQNATVVALKLGPSGASTRTRILIVSYAPAPAALARGAVRRASTASPKYKR
jgi:hypothetical protein